MKFGLRPLPLLAACVLLPGCVFYSTARHWNGLVDEDSQPSYYTTTTKIGLRAFILLPFVGNMSIDGLVDDMTAEIKAKGGDHIQMVQGGTETYWYGWPPLTWIVTPVISTVAAEYRPSPAQFEADQAEIRAEAAEEE